MNSATLVLWSHALAALLFAGLAIHAWRSSEMGLPRRPLTARDDRVAEGHHEVESDRVPIRPDPRLRKPPADSRQR